MAGVNFSALLDAIDSTLTHQVKSGQTGGYVTLLSRPDYEVSRRIFNENRYLAKGSSLTWHIQYKTAGNAAWVKPFDTETTSHTDVMTSASAQWTRLTGYALWDVGEFLGNQGPEQVYDLVKQRMRSSEIEMADALETDFWLAPTNSSDTTHPLGVNYHMPAITGAQVTSATSGFQGQTPVYRDGSSASSWCGIDRTATGHGLTKTFNNVWSNSAGDITDTDVDNLGIAMTRTHYMAPGLTDMAEFKTRYGLYGGYTVKAALERRARQQNASNGPDITMYRGAALVGGTPFRYVSALDTSAYPMVCMNWDSWRVAVLEGMAMVRHKPKESKETHNAIVVYTDLQCQVIMTDPQKCGFRFDYVAAA